MLVQTSRLVRSYKMTRKYTIEESGVIWYEENEVRYSFLPDPANSDYQAYLATLASESAPTA